MPKRSYSAQNAHVIGVHVPPRALIAEFVATEGLSKQWIEPLHQTIVHMVEAIRVFAKPSPAARQQRLKQMGTVLKATKSLADIVTQEPAATSLNDLFSRELGSSLSTQAFERTGLVVTDRLSPHTLGGRAAQGRNGPYAALEDEAMQLRILYARKLGANVLEEVLRNLTGPVEAYLALERQSKGGRPADNHRRFVISRLALIYPILSGSEPQPTVTGPFVRLCEFVLKSLAISPEGLEDAVRRELKARGRNSA